MKLFGGLAIRTKLFLLAGVPVAGALILASVIGLQAHGQAAAAAALGSIEDVAQLSVEISGLIHALQLERARAAMQQGFAATAIERVAPTEFALRAGQANAAQERLERFLANHDLSKLPPRLARDLGLARVQAAKRDDFRARLVREQVPIDDILNFYATANDALVSATSSLTKLSDDGELLRSISSLVALAQLSERASRQHALLSYVLASGEFPPGAFKTFVTLSTEQSVYSDAFRASADNEEERRYEEFQASKATVRALAMREKALRTADDNFDIDPASWFDTQSRSLGGLQDIESDLLVRITAVAKRKMQASQASVRLGLWLSAGVVFASALLAWLIARGVTRTVFALSSAAEQVRSTKNFAIRASKTSTDELGNLTDVFNEMLGTIQARDVYLETQVAERTEELRRTVADLWSEMDLARKIQTVLLPRDPQLPSYEIAAIMVPASTVGGDYYDVFQQAGADWILIGDVSGHGVTAGLSMMIVQTAVRTVIQSAEHAAPAFTPKEVLSKVNAAVRSNLQKINEDQYVTIMALQLDGERVCYSGLHQDILVFRNSSRKVERIETRGIWVGLLDDISGLVDDDIFSMNDGDLVLLHTDGLTETLVDGRRLGTDGLAAAFQRLAAGTADPAAIVEGLIGQLRGSTLSDDVTVLVARYAPRTGTA